MECDFCKRTFSSKSNLLNHQKTTKYCIEMQGKQPTYFECGYCNKKFTSHQNQIEHSCKERERENNIKQQKEFEHNIKNKYDLKIKELEYLIINRDERIKGFESIINEKNEYISKLEARLDKFESTVVTLAAEPKTTTNVVVKSKTENKTEMPIPLHEQMSSIVIEEIKDDGDKEHYSITLNNIVITSRPIDHYVNATQLCQAGGKLFKDWFRLESTKELINELSTDGRIPPSALVETKRGGNDKSKQGSWIHPDLSIQLAQWISPKFAIQVSKWVRTLFNQGSIEIDLNLLREKERDMRIKDHRIKQLETVCLSKQRRVEYPERNVIYMLTTDDHLQRRTYIIGKAKNLTNRLSTYNKTCDHTVVHYRECKSEEDMETAETMVLTKLREYREQANRDRLSYQMTKMFRILRRLSTTVFVFLFEIIFIVK
jgi:hypothetical protein